MVSFRLVVVLGLFVAAMSACAPKEDVTPEIVVSPGARERIMVMDRFRHHGAPRRILPRVTVEEVDEADLPPAPAGEAAKDEGAVPSDAASPAGEVVSPPAREVLPTKDERPDHREHERDEHEDGRD